MELSKLMLFVTTSLALLVVPGPAVLYIIARSLQSGIRAGLVSVLGVSAGGLVHVFSAAVGLSALLAQSALAFMILKYLGAAYLIYLGLSKLKQKRPHVGEIQLPSASYGELFWKGFAVEALNPKVAIFFLAFLPQFADPSLGHVNLQIALLGCLFLLIALVSDGLYAVFAGNLKNILSNKSADSIWDRIVGFGYLGLGYIFAKSNV